VQTDNWGSPGTWEILSFPRQTPGWSHRVTNSRPRRRTRPPRSEPSECDRGTARPTAGRLLVHRPIGTAVCYAPDRFHTSRSLSASFEKGNQFCQVKKTRAVQEGRWADAHKGHRQRIGLVGPFPRHGKRAVCSPLENQRLPPSCSAELEDWKPLSLKRMERMGDFRRARRRAAVKCSYR
jgi:hypothetical protein